MKLKLLSAICGIALTGGVVWSADGIQVGGNLNQTVVVGKVESDIGASGGIVKQEVGVIKGNIDVKGNLEQEVNVKSVKSSMSLAVGRISQRVGVIDGDDIRVSGNLKQTVKAGNIEMDMMAGGGNEEKEIGVLSGKINHKGNLNQDVNVGDVKDYNVGGISSQTIGKIGDKIKEGWDAITDW